MEKPLKLVNGSRSAVIGDGPSGSLTSYFMLDMAKRVDLYIHLDIFEAQDFSNSGPAGSNQNPLSRCFQQKDSYFHLQVVQRGIDSYVMHTDNGQQRFDTPLNEKRIAAVCRGSVPLGKL